MDSISFEKLNQELRDEKFFVVDRKVFDLYREKLACLRDKSVLLIEKPEERKSFEGLQTVVEFLLEEGIGRRDTVVALGGGALSDLAGFAAAIVARGVSWVCVPTTLLSAVDAAIGGKTAINTKHGKNLAGAFHSPEKILFCRDFLATLPDEEISSGKGEILKYAFLSKEIYNAIISEKPLEEVISLCAAAKAEIVEKDFKESGERAKLNLGHTFGHAIEKLTGIGHGLCVAMGLEMVVDLFAPSLVGEFQQAKKSLRLQYSFPRSLDATLFWTTLGKDKKKTNDGISFIIPRSFGEVSIETKQISDLKTAVENNDKYRSLLV